MKIINTQRQGEIETGGSILGKDHDRIDGMYLAIRTNTWGTSPVELACVHLDVEQAQTLIDALQAQIKRIKDNDPTALRKHAFGLFKVVFGEVPAKARHAYTKGILGEWVDPSWREGNLTTTQMRRIIASLEGVCEAEDLVAAGV